MKAILVIDKLENCSKCPCHNGEWGYCQADKKERQIRHEDFPSWCPLKPMPQKNIYDSNNWATTDFEDGFTLGDYLNKARNEVIDEILGEQE